MKSHRLQLVPVRFSGAPGNRNCLEQVWNDFNKIAVCSVPGAAAFARRVPLPQPYRAVGGYAPGAPAADSEPRLSFGRALGPVTRHGLPPDIEPATRLLEARRAIQ